MNNKGTDKDNEDDDLELSDVSIGPERQGLALYKKAFNKDCVYCLRRNLKVVLVLENCGHYYCPHCLLQQYHISTVTQGLGLPNPGIKGSQKFIRCYQCKQYHAINELQIKQLNHLAKNKKIKPPVAKPPIEKGLKKCQTCLKLTNSVKQIQDAEYECLTCNMLLCQ